MLVGGRISNNSTGIYETHPTLAHFPEASA